MPSTVHIAPGQLLFVAYKSWLGIWSARARGWQWAQAITSVFISVVELPLLLSADGFVLATVRQTFIECSFSDSKGRARARMIICAIHHISSCHITLVYSWVGCRRTSLLGLSLLTNWARREQLVMLTVPELAAEALGSCLASDMNCRFGATRADLIELISSVARLALECIGNSDALYHNVEHTMLVTLAGNDILKGRSLLVPTSPEDYAHLIIACLLHDIGYVRGILAGDTHDEFVIDAAGRKTKITRGASDAALTPYHVERSKLFALDRLKSVELIDSDRVARAIEATRFPSNGNRNGRNDYEEGSLVRAADLIGYIGDPNYLRKTNALFREFEETGLNRQFGYETPADLIGLYPQFYYSEVAPHIQSAMRYLNVTSAGRRWIASLYSNIFRAEGEPGCLKKSPMKTRGS
jgi:hypothetical protein